MLFVPAIALAQPVVETKPIKIYTELGGYYGTNNQTPFWMQANQFGTIPKSVPYATFRVGAQMDHLYTPLAQTGQKRKKDRFGWGYGVEAVVNSGPEGTEVIVPEAYVKGRLGAFEIMAGRRRDLIGLADSTVGMGSYAWSGNALPVPKVQISLPDFTPLPFTKGLVAFRGLYSHGWFENQDRIVQNSFLHQKALYGRVGKPGWRVKFYGGFNHQVQWGGRSSRLPETLARNGRLPSTLRDYVDVVTGNSLGYRRDIDTTRISKMDRENRIGNHLGTIDLGVEFRISNRFELLLYRQSIFEDGSLYYLINIKDGLQGIRLRNLRPLSSGFQIRDVVVEYMATLSQGGGDFGDLPKQRGRDNYFNHSQYWDGWSYFTRTIGTPFIPNGRDTHPDLVRYSYTNNNRVQVMHLGVSGGFGLGGTFALRSSFSRNFGSWVAPFPDHTNQFSAALNVGLPVSRRRGWLVTTTIATDQGKLYPNSTAVYAGVRKTWEYYKYRVRGK